MKKQFNKKKVITPLMVILGIGLVMAGAYYVMFSDTFNITEAFTLSGDSTDALGPFYESNEPIVETGATRTITSNADDERLVTFTNNADAYANVAVSYVGTLELTKKTVNFDLDVWVIPINAEKVEIEYTVVGDKFSAEVVGVGISGYELIYYKDAEIERFDNPAKAIRLNEIVGNLPYAKDGNAEEYNYCEPFEYNTCHGAKIWYVPSNAILTNNELDWNKASKFYFESSLIQYNKLGQITVYPTEALDFKPVYTIEPFTTGSATIITEVI